MSASGHSEIKKAADCEAGDEHPGVACQGQKRGRASPKPGPEAEGASSETGTIPTDRLKELEAQLARAMAEKRALADAKGAVATENEMLREELAEVL